MKKILTSVLSIGIVSALAFYGTNAFFSDTETSSGNTFTAGSVDLKIDSQCHYFQNGQDVGCGDFGTWTSRDLTQEKFFNFADVKPGDYGENTLSMTVQDNDAWACMHIGNVQNAENSLIEPEVEAGDNTPGVGELAQNLHFTAWLDQGTTPGFGDSEDSGEGDNVWQGPQSEPLLFANESGPASDVLNGKTYTLADSTAITGPLTGGVTHYIGLQWCAGDLIISGSTITCDGASMGNQAQTDSLSADVSFYVEQSRNNANFSCSSVTWPTPETQTITVTPNNLHNWFFYNDETDVIDMSLGSFVTPPATPPLGTGSVKIDVSGTQRRNLATYQFGGAKLADIDALSYSTYQPSSNPGSSNRVAYLQFNVDFNGSDTWQKRLLFLPSQNGTVQQDAWQTWDAINSGNALWGWSGFGSNGNKWPDGNTNPYRTLSDLISAFPNIRIRVTDSWLGMRVGEPYSDGFTGYIDNFSITINGAQQTFDFEQ